MRSWISLLCGAVLLAGFAAGPVGAAVPIDWDPAYTWEPNATPTNSVPGNILQGVGIVSSFGDPFQDLDANDPTTEYTFYFYNLVSQGTVTYGSPGLQFFNTDYSGGVFELYAGSPRNSVFAPNPPNAQVPSTFIDGTLILAGVFTSFQTQTNDFTANQVGNMEGEINWTGGTLLDRTFRGGQPCPGLFTGGITWRTDVLIPGYIFRHDGKIDLNCPTPADPSSWGRIKASYR